MNIKTFGCDPYFDWYSVSRFIKVKFLSFSFGTFSFWSAYLRPVSWGGEVIVADGYYGQPPLLLRYIKETRLPSWQFLADPCYRPLTASMANRKPLLTKHCEEHKQEFGIYWNKNKTELIWANIFMNLTHTFSCIEFTFPWI